jgi:hypothetical protein
MNTYTLSSAPTEVTALYDTALRRAIDAGSPREVAERKALRHTQHAGWFRTAKGWQRLQPDLRDRVNVRDAVQQPDGTFVVEDVDVFYANAVKGHSSMTYDPADVAAMIRNTNRSIAAGSQRPGLVEGHPHPLQFAAGMQLDSFGAAVNFRASPRGPAWARCDLVDVKPEAVDRLKARKLTGLSAGIVEDAGKLNRRFGHVAMLGGSSQALSLLPAVEVFSSHNTVCFSAESPADAFPKGTPMFTEKQKAAFSALSAAFAAFAAGEPGSQDKLSEARASYSAAFEGEESPMELPADPTATAPGAPIDATATATGAGVPDFAANPAGAFEAVKIELGNNQRLAADQTKLIKVLQGQIAGMVGQKIRGDFDATVAELKREGHQLPADEAIAGMFGTCFSASDPQKAVTQYVALLKATPKRESLAAAGTIFGAEGAAASGKQKDAPGASLYDVLVDMNASNFSAEDLKLGEALLKGINRK